MDLSMFVEYGVNVTNHLIDKLLEERKDRKKQVVKISIATKRKSVGHQNREFDVGNGSDLPMYQAFVEWRRSPPDHPNDPWKRAGWIGELGPGENRTLQMGVADPDKLPRVRPQARLIFKLDGRWWMHTTTGEADRLWFPPSDAFPKRRRQRQQQL
jgi:hypothetical protein